MTHCDPSAPSTLTARTTTIERIDDQGQVWIVGSARPCVTLSGTAPAVWATAAAEQAPVLVYENETDAPILVGVVCDRVAVAARPERVEITAQERVTITCGEASITLTRAGKVLITGTEVLTQARGTHRIHGGSVRLNG